MEFTKTVVLEIFRLSLFFRLRGM